MTSRTRVIALAVAVALLGGCGGVPTESTAKDAAAQDPAGGSAAGDGHGHVHDHGAARVSMPVGDGTRSYEVGYTLRDVQLPEQAGQPGVLRFVVDNHRGRPHTDYLAEQDKRMHVYVVRTDLAVFRHVHPEMSPDGTWSGNLTLPEPGDYRVVAEFVARDDGGNGDHVLLGAERTVPGDWDPRPDRPGRAGPDWGVVPEVLVAPAAGVADELRIRLTRPDASAPRLGEYLGTSAHLTGFHVGTGGVVHMHPIGGPETGPDGTDLAFHAELPQPGEYLLYLQVRVDDFLHTVPVRLTAS